MLRDITLPFWPTSYSSFKWSQDGQLCLAVDNRVYVLAPTCFSPLQTVYPPGRIGEEKPRQKAEEDAVKDAGKSKKATAKRESTSTSTNAKKKQEGKGKEKAGVNGKDTEGDVAMNDAAHTTANGAGENNAAELDNDDYDVEDCDYEKFLHPLEEAFTLPRRQFHYSQIQVEIKKEPYGYAVDVQDWSAPETENPSLIFKLEWSPLGVGRNKRCVLTVLTSGHKVLLYSPKSRLGGEWELFYDVTKFLRQPEANGDGVEEDHAARVKRWYKTRTRDISWSHACNSTSNNRGYSLLSLSNDCNDITLVSVTARGMKQHLRKRIANTDGTYIKNMSWSPWSPKDESSASAWLTFSLGHQQYVLRVEMDLQSDGEALVSLRELHSLTTAITLSHQPSATCWFPRLLKSSLDSESNAVMCLLAVVLQTSVEVYTVDAASAKFTQCRKLQKSEVDLPDSIVGASFVYGKGLGTINLNIVTVNGTFVQIPYAPDEKFVSAIIYNSGDMSRNEKTVQKIDFMRSFQRRRLQFMRRFKITNASCRNFGMAVSPFAGYVAILSRMKPEGYVEFTMKNDEDSVIVFSHSRNLESFLNFEEDGIVLPLRSSASELSTEGFLADISHIARYLKSNTAFYNTLENQLASKEVYRLQTAIKLLRRNQISVRTAATLVPPRATTNRLLYSTLSIPVEALQEMLSSSKLSQKIIYFYACVAIIGFYIDERIFTEAAYKLNILRDGFGYDIEEERTLIVKRIAAIRGDVSANTVPEAINEHALETCKWCGSGMPFRDLGTAYCTNNHQFRRCALTFVALQQGSARSCSICAREFFTEEMLLDDEENENDGSVGTQHEDNSVSRRGYKSLARLWFETIDLCPYCGGCFTE